MSDKRTRELRGSGARKEKILFISYDLEDFFGEDFRILSKYYDTKSVTVKGLFDLGLKKFKIFRGIMKSDLVVVWFGSMTAFMATLYARILGKKSLIIGGGFDVLNMPDINYGVYRHKFRSLFTTAAFGAFEQKMLEKMGYARTEKFSFGRGTGLHQDINRHH